MFATTMMMAISSGALAIIAATPTSNAPHIASIFAGLFGGLIVQGWTFETRKPTKAVMISDIGASCFSGLIANVMGVPAALACINRILPEDIQIAFEITDHLAASLVVAGFAGMVGAGLLRKLFDRINPTWMNGDGRPK